MTNTETSNTPAVTDSDVEESHIVCCRDGDTSLCGEHCPDDQYAWDEDGIVNCGGCLIAEQFHDCPRYGSCLNP
jgi:hypothetical protein